MCLERLDQVAPLLPGEPGAEPDLPELAVGKVQTQQQRTYRGTPLVLGPAPADQNTVRGQLALELAHLALAGSIRGVHPLGHHPVESPHGELLQPSVRL